MGREHLVRTAGFREQPDSWRRRAAGTAPPAPADPAPERGDAQPEGGGPATPGPGGERPGPGRSPVDPRQEPPVEEEAAGRARAEPGGRRPLADDGVPRRPRAHDPGRGPSTGLRIIHPCRRWRPCCRSSTIPLPSCDSAPKTASPARAASSSSPCSTTSPPPSVDAWRRPCGWPRRARTLASCPWRSDMRRPRIRTSVPPPSACWGPSAASRPSRSWTRHSPTVPEGYGRKAAAALGILHHWPSAPRVSLLLADDSWQVRRIAAQSLRVMGAPGLLYLRRASRADGPGRDVAQHVLDLPEALARVEAPR